MNRNALFTNQTADGTSSAVTIPSWRRVYVTVGGGSGTDLGGGTINVEVSTDGGTTYDILASFTAVGGVELPQSGPSEYLVRATLSGATSPDITSAVITNLHHR